MKKYFLLVSLVMVVFLGLGNISIAQEVDLGPSVLDGGTSQNIPTPPPSQTQVNMNTNNSNPTPVTTAPQQGVSNNCQGGTLVGGLICDCGTGKKLVDKVCKSCTDPDVCCGVELNTSVPFVGKCIEDTPSNVGGDETGVTSENAFPVLMGSMTKILVTVILIVSFVLIVVGGIMIATGDASGGKKMIIKVVIGIALLGASGVILRLINPNFFG